MDYNQQYQSSSSAYPPRKANAFATASLVMGILALVTLCTIYLPIVFGSLSIIFAVLSKGNERKICGLSCAGIITSVSGIVFSIITIVTTIALLYSNPDFYQEYKDEMNRILSEQYGITYDEMMEEYQNMLE